MRSTMHRRLATVLAAALAAAAFEVGPGAAVAAPSASPFAGSYHGNMPGTAFGYGGWTIAIDAGGHVTGAYDEPWDHGLYFLSSAGSVSGRVGADGTLTVSGKEWTYANPNAPVDRGGSRSSFTTSTAG